jgi:hypothetical protein
MPERPAKASSPGLLAFCELQLHLDAREAQREVFFFSIQREVFRLVHALQEEWIRARKEKNLKLRIFIYLYESSRSGYLAELAFSAYAYIDGHRLLPVLAILGRRHHSAAISPWRLQIMLHRISDPFI